MNKKISLAFVSTTILLVITIFIAINTGNIKASPLEIFNLIFNKTSNSTLAILDLRFPRIIIAILVGAALAVSGLLLQTTLKNPLIDPSLVGVSGGANLILYLGLLVSPSAIIYKSFFAIVGGIVGYLLIFAFARNIKNNVSIILIGIAISSFFTGLLTSLSFLENTSKSLARASLGIKSWEDVKLLLIWIPITIVIALLLAKVCNIFFLDDKVIASLGLNINLLRFTISLLAVILASIATSVVGVLAFLSLIAPHIAKIIVGKNHIYSLPFSALVGALIFLGFDTLGRSIFNPIEIPADILMLVVGGPCFLILIKTGGKYE
ncbi:iron ABC transporter permease [Gemella sp. zg-570]|uniref:FecCD family ABC transporter permease n=1 Tax=Gemella sp. zg-570 TaxID=2840371 RepID=UPI001C0C68BA|nr:iron ABC transporter permease [Gemella sp. zg-570]QWQ38549.1 iron ABC transporter permease [Gemella sp. zg-570]